MEPVSCHNLTVARKDDPSLFFTHTVAIYGPPWPTDPEITARSFLDKATRFLSCGLSDLTIPNQARGEGQ